MKKCAILIPSIHKRAEMLQQLKWMLEDQIQFLDAKKKQRVWFGIFTEVDDGSMTIGTKRNNLVKKAANFGADYAVFFDDDDKPEDLYIEILDAGIASGADVISLRGNYSSDGAFIGVFEHSIKYSAYKTNPDGSDIKFERYPNHLNCMKFEVMKQFPFPEINHGEDTKFATAVFKSGLLKKEYYTDQIVYNYLHITKK